MNRAFAELAWPLACYSECMRWQPGHSSPDLIDRRGARGGGGGLGGILWLLPLLLRTPLGWVVLLVVGAVWLGGRFCGGADPARDAARDQAGERGAVGTARSGDEAKQFVGFVLDDAQDTWSRVFASRGGEYRRAKLVLFTDATQTACGYGQAATGPFYCPRDERVYLDLGFFRELDAQLGAAGDFAQAYVIAHEIGHHVQHQLGITERVHGSPEGAKGESGASVRLELQADCFAGVWAHGTRERALLERGDLEEATTAAAAIGDDRLQREASGTVSPDRFTHGTSQQRVRWFRRGMESGSVEACDTFSAREL